MDPDVVKLMRILGFDTESLPKMKELTKQFYKQSLIRHPDKPGGTKEQFQELLDAYHKLGVIIEGCKNEDPEDKDELLARNLFKQFNFETENMYSFTISIRNSEYSKWEKVLTEKYGEPIDRSEKGNGKQYVINYKMDKVNSSKMYLTLYHKPRAASGTLFVQAEKSRHFLNIDFVSNTLPFLYADVVHKHKQHALETKNKIVTNAKKETVKTTSKAKTALISACDNESKGSVENKIDNIKT